MARSMSDFEKYWSCSMSLDVACFLDPRYKNKLVEFYMRKFYGHYYDVRVDEVVGVMKNLYQFYASNATTSQPKNDKTANDHNRTMDPSARNQDEVDSFLYDDVGPGISDLSELDKYMVEPLIKQNPFDILSFWKNNTNKYSILSQIARDIMVVQVYTISSESAFSAGGQVIDPYRNWLDPKMVQALICTKDWIHSSWCYEVPLFSYI
jgi:hypothetical protein